MYIRSGKYPQDMIDRPGLLISSSLQSDLAAARKALIHDSLNFLKFLQARHMVFRNVGAL